jgi:predicted N-acyltransferase
VGFRVVHGDEAGDADLAAMHRFYLDTFAGYGNTPTLTLDFLRHLARAMPRQLVLFLAQRDGRNIAGALCLREGLARFEPGAQGEHKLARGFLPAPVRSRHWIADPDFAAALAPWCAEESREIRRYAEALAAHSPFRARGD